MIISIVAAVSKNGVIGTNCRLPWYLSADLSYFKNLTLDKTVIMGRKTYESIGHPLPQRTNIIISSNPNYSIPGCQIYTSLHEALDKVQAEEIMIIGGGNLYAQALPIAAMLYLTFVDTVCDGDVFFPEINAKEWKEISRKDNLADENNPHNYSFVTLTRCYD